MKTESEKAIDLCNETLDENLNCCQSWRTIRVVKYALESALKRTAEVEKEKEEAVKQWRSTSEKLITAAKELQSQAVELDRAKQALENANRLIHELGHGEVFPIEDVKRMVAALQPISEYYEDFPDIHQGKAAGEISFGDLRLIKAALKTPTAQKYLNPTK